MLGTYALRRSSSPPLEGSRPSVVDFKAILVLKAFEIDSHE